MADIIGNITVPEIAAAGVFPIVPDYPYGRASHPDVAIHQFGSGNAKIEQRFLLGTGARRFTVRRSWMNDAQRTALRNFWEAKYGPYGAFTYNVPNDDGNGTTAVTCRFENEPLSWAMVADWVCSIGVTLVEIPAATPAYALNSTVTRFPTAPLQGGLLAQAQEVIPLVKIQPLEAGYPAIYLSDRRCTVGGQLYQARLLQFDGIQQGMGGEADDASFTFGNADRVMRDLANDVDMYRASIAFSLFHVGLGIKLDLWKGDITNWTIDAGPEFKVTATDGLYELNLPYPTRKISRTCWKALDGDACPFSQAGALDLVHFPGADGGSCDKNYDTPNGCLAHGMKRYYGGVVAQPEGVNIKDNSTGVWGFGRSGLTSTSLVADSIYDQIVPEIYTDTTMPVNCKVAAGRDESDFYEAMGIVGEGPIGAFTTTGMQDKDGDGNAETFVGPTLDGQPHHGFPNNNYGLRTYIGNDPADPGDWFSLDSSGDHTGGNWRLVYSGGSTMLDNFAAGTAFIVLRRTDAKGLQLSKPQDHAMQAMVYQGLGGWSWASPGNRTWTPGLTNPVWIAINMLLRARGLRLGSGATGGQLNLAETLFDVAAAVAAATKCNQQVAPVVYGTIKVWGSDYDENDPNSDPTSGHWEDQEILSETQFKFRGALQEEKPLRDWLQEVLMNCLGYYTFSFGKLKIGVRDNSSVVEAFTEGNILFRSLQLAPLKPSFNHLSANFADQEFDFVSNSVAVYDIDHASLIGGGAGPLFLKSTINLSGTASKSQAGRIIATRLREELGGTGAPEWKAARQIGFKTTVLALNTEPGMVCSMTHADMPGGAGEFRITGWRLNPDLSIDVQGHTTTDSMYDLASPGPKPADVGASPVPGETILGLIPGDVQPIAGQPFLVTATDGAADVAFEIQYEPPATIGMFQGVTVHVELPDASGKVAMAVDSDYTGDPEGMGAARYGTCKVVVPKGAADQDIRIYLTSRSRTYKTPLVFHGVAGESPNVQQHIGAATGASGATPPANVAIGTVDVALGPINGQRIITISYTAPDPVGTFAGIYVEIEAPDQSGEAAAELSGDTTLDGSVNLSGPQAPLSFGPFAHSAAQGCVRVEIPEPDATTLPMSCRLRLLSYSADMVDDAATSPDTTFVIPAQTVAKPNAGTAYCQNPTITLAATASDGGPNPYTESDTGKKRTHFWVNMAPPSPVDPAFRGAVYVLMWEDGFTSVLTGWEPGAQHEIVLDTPADLRYPVLYAPGSDGEHTNPIVPGITPAIPLTLGTTTGTIDAGATLEDSIKDTEFEIATEGGKKILRIKGLDLTKAFNFNTADFKVDPATGKWTMNAIDMSKAEKLSAQFEWDPNAQVQQITNIDAKVLKTGIFQLGGGGDKVSLAKFFDTAATPALMGFVGDDTATPDNPDGSGYVGAWWLRCGIGGSGPLAPAFFCGVDGKVVATAIYIADNTGASGLIGSGISWFRRLAAGGADAQHPQLICDVNGNLTLPTACITGTLAIGGTSKAVNLLVGYDGADALCLWAGKHWTGATWEYGLWARNIWAGGSAPADAPFAVDSNGKLSISMTSANAGATPFQLYLNNLYTTIGNALATMGGASTYRGIEVVDATVGQRIALAMNPGGLSQIGVWEGVGLSKKAILWSNYNGGTGLNLEDQSGACYIRLANATTGGLLSMLGPAAGKTFAVDVAACTISIGSALSIVTTGGNGLSTTISYTKSGGGTGTLTFTQGILTGST